MSRTVLLFKYHIRFIFNCFKILNKYMNIIVLLSKTFKYHLWSSMQNSDMLNKEEGILCFLWSDTWLTSVKSCSAWRCVMQFLPRVSNKSARTTYVMWREKRFWNVGVQQRPRLFNLVTLCVRFLACFYCTQLEHWLYHMYHHCVGVKGRSCRMLRLP
jgi:hypothetical protein